MSWVAADGIVREVEDADEEVEADVEAEAEVGAIEDADPVECSAGELGSSFLMSFFNATR